MIFKNALLSFILLNSCFFACSQNSNTPLKKKNHNINKVIKSILADKEFKNASFSFLAVDVKTGEVVAEHDPDLSLMPASTLKVVTTATAMEVLGKYYTYKTHLEYSGTLDTVNKVLNGNIYIKGGADPTLGSRYFDKNRNYAFLKQWVGAIKKLKINKINGMIIGDASKYSYEITPPKRTWENVGNYFGQGGCGLNIFDNLYEVYFDSPALPDKLVSIAKIDPKIPGIQLYNEVLSSNIRSDEAYFFGAPYRYLQIARGTIPKGKRNFRVKAAIPDPAFYTAWRLKNELDSTGIKTVKKATTLRLLQQNGDTIKGVRHKFHTFTSPSLLSIATITNKNSNNFFAENLFNEIAYKLKKDGSNRVGIEAVTDFWKYKGMDTDGFHIYDGSGLSRFNAVTARHLVFILKYMRSKSKNSDAFYKSLAIAGKSGTLRATGRNTSAVGKIYGKSGWIRRVRSFTGYATTKSGRELAFYMNITNYNCKAYQAKNKIVPLLIAMTDFNL